MDDEHSSRRERRQYYRLRYPLAERPRLAIQDTTFAILDISERGIRFKAARGMTFREGDAVAMTIELPNERFEVAGKVIRVEDSSVGILLSGSIPLATIRAVERNLRERYPYRS